MRFRHLLDFVLVYYDARVLSPHIDAVHLFAFDQKTPERNPKEADFPAPIYDSYGRVPDDNVDAPTRYNLKKNLSSLWFIVNIEHKQNFFKKELVP